MDIRTLDEKEILDAENLFRASFISMNDFEVDKEKRDHFEAYLKDIKKNSSYIGVYEKDLDAVICYSNITYELLMIASRDEESAIKNQFILLSVVEKELKHIGCNALNIHVFSNYQEQYEKLGFKVVSTQDDYSLSLIQMEYLFNQEYLGKEVNVIVDQPYGSFHSHIPDLLLPVNVGYVNEAEFLDDAFQDAYIYGLEEPIEEYRGTVIAIVYRKDGSTVFVVSKKTSFDQKDVINTIGELEQYQDTQIIWMK